MALDAVFERFVHPSPLPVMARLLMQRALSPEWLDGLFEEHRQRQYTRERLFCTEVSLMALVALGPAAVAACGRPGHGRAEGVDAGALREGEPHRVAGGAGAGTGLRGATEARAGAAEAPAAVLGGGLSGAGTENPRVGGSIPPLGT